MSRLLKFSLALAALTAALAVMPAEAKRVKTTRGRLKATPTRVEAPAVYCDTLDYKAFKDGVGERATSAEPIGFAGYDKPLRGRKETLFVTNRTGKELMGVVFRISYFDSAKRLLHRARHEVGLEVPAGETRRIDLTSWDKQQTFYYRGSKRGRSAGVPYTIEIETDTIFLAK